MGTETLQDPKELVWSDLVWYAGAVYNIGINNTDLYPLENPVGI